MRSMISIMLNRYAGFCWEVELCTMCRFLESVAANAVVQRIRLETKSTGTISRIEVELQCRWLIRPSITANTRPPIAESVSVQPTQGSLNALITMDGLTMQIFMLVLRFYNVRSVSAFVKV